MFSRKTIAGFIATGAAACLLAAGLATPANATQANNTPADVVLVTIQNRLTNKCVAVPGGSHVNKVQVIQYTCTGNPEQLWNQVFMGFDDYDHPIYVFQNLESLKCLTSAGGNGGAAWQYDCNTANLNQRWSQDGADRLHSNSSGDCLAVPGGQRTEALPLIHWTCGTGAEQKWDIY